MLLARCRSCLVSLRVAAAVVCRLGLALALAAAAAEASFQSVLEMQLVLANPVVHSISMLGLVVRAASYRSSAVRASPAWVVL